MKNKNVSHQDTKLISNLGITVIILIGVIFIAISLLIPIGSTAGYFHELLKELGIVLFSVFAVSWIYERLVTKRLLSEFNEALKTQINDIENISATYLEISSLSLYNSNSPSTKPTSTSSKSPLR